MRLRTTKYLCHLIAQRVQICKMILKLKSHCIKLPYGRAATFSHAPHLLLHNVLIGSCTATLDRYDLWVLAEFVKDHWRCQKNKKCLGNLSQTTSDAAENIFEPCELDRVRS